jgi:hypothetical protein
MTSILSVPVPDEPQSGEPPTCPGCDRRHGDSEPEKLVCALRFYSADNSLPDDLTAQVEAVADAIEERETDIAVAAHEKWIESGGGRY